MKNLDNIVLLDPAYGKGFTIKNNGGYELLLNPAQSYILADDEACKRICHLQVRIRIPEGEKELISLSGDWTGKRLDAKCIDTGFCPLLH